MNAYLLVALGLVALGCLLLAAASPQIRIDRRRRAAGRHHEHTVEIVPPDYRPPTGRRQIDAFTDDTERIEYPR